MEIEVRELHLLGNAAFPGSGSDLRRSITAIFRDNPLFHNHKPGGSYQYSAPRIRYLVDQGTPKLISIGAGNHELERVYELFAESHLQLDVRGNSFLAREAVLVSRNARLGIVKDGVAYRSITPWLAFNSKNSGKFNLLNKEKKKDFLSRLFTANIISLAKNLDFWVPDKVISRITGFREVPVVSGGMNMLGIYCRVESNFEIDHLLGLGKLVSKGFGRFAGSKDIED
jgi:hypothetical protein